MVVLNWIFRNATRQPLHGGSARFRRSRCSRRRSWRSPTARNDAQKTMGIITLALVAGGRPPDRQHDPVCGHRALRDGASASAPPPAAGGSSRRWAKGRRAGAGPRVRRGDHRRHDHLRRRHFGMPVSTTHVISSAIMGVGSSKGTRGVRWGVARSILVAWVLTIPAADARRRGRVVHPERDRDPMRRSPREPAKGTHHGSTDPPRREVLRPVHRGRREPARRRSRKLEEMIAATTGSTSGCGDPGAREEGDEIDQRGRGAARAGIHHAVRPRGHPRARVHLDDVVDGIQAIAETFMIYGVKQPTDDAQAPGRDPHGAGGAAQRGAREARALQGHRAPPRRSTSSSTRPTGSRGPRSGGCSAAATRRSRSSSCATSTRRSRTRSTPPRTRPRSSSGSSRRSLSG